MILVTNGINRVWFNATRFAGQIAATGYHIEMKVAAVQHVGVFALTGVVFVAASWGGE